MLIILIKIHRVSQNKELGKQNIWIGIIRILHSYNMILLVKKAKGGVLLFDISTTSCWDCQIIEPSCQTDA